MLNGVQLAPKHNFDVAKYNTLKESAIKAEAELQEIKHS